LTEESSASLDQVAAAFVVADWLFDLEGLWRQIESGTMQESSRLLLFDRMAGIVRSHMAELLRAGAGRIAPGELCRQLQAGVGRIGEKADDLLGPETRRHSESLYAELTQHGAPDDLASAVVHMYDLDGVVGLAQLSDEKGLDPLELTMIFVDLGTRLGLNWAQGTAANMNPFDPWERLLISGLARELQQVRLEFLRRLTVSRKARNDPAQAVANWAETHAKEIAQFRATVDRAQSSAPITSAMLAHIAGQAQNLLVV